MSSRGLQRAERPQAPRQSLDLHHLAGRLSCEHLRSQSESEWTGDTGTERLPLLELLHLLGDELNQLLDLLELRGHQLKQLLKLQKLLLLKELQLLELLGQDLQQLHDLHRADSVRPDA